MSHSKFLHSLFVLLLTATLASCGGSSSNLGTQPPSSNSGSVFVMGTDAPLASVLSFRVSVTGMTASDGTNTVPIFTGSQEIDFARLNGLRTLLDVNTIPAGSYTSVTLTLSSPVISYLKVSPAPPTINTLNGTLTQSSVTILLRQPLVVKQGDLVGLLFDFHLRDSLEVDPNGDLTGRVVPNIDLRAIPPDAPEAQIDEFRGGVVSVDLNSKSFVMQGPHGRHFTVVTNDQTQWGPDGETLNSLDTNTIVQVSGSLQRNSLTLLATEVVVLTKDRFLLGGLLTDVRPPTGTANQIDLFVRSELPDLTNAPVGQIATLGFDGNERFWIYEFRIPLAAFLFNRDALVRGQRVSAGGLLDTSSNPPKLDVRRVVLHRQGLEGTWVPGSTNLPAGTFSFNASGLAGVVFNQPVKVMTSSFTRFIGLAGLGDLTGNSPIRLRVVGLVLKDSSGNPVIVARVVEKL